MQLLVLSIFSQHCIVAVDKLQLDTIWHPRLIYRAVKRGVPVQKAGPAGKTTAAAGYIHRAFR